MKTLLLCLVALLLVDFVSGLGHWAEDTFWTADTPVLGRWLVAPNLQHHEEPAAFLGYSYWRSNGDLLLVGGAVLAVAAALGMLSAPVVLFALVGGNANQIHKWAHMPRRKVPLPVRWLQSARLLQSTRHHNRHHGGDKNTHYCTVTSLLNPVLDRLGFWRGLERLVATPANAPRRADLWGTAPAARS